MGLLFEFYLHSVNTEVKVQPLRRCNDIDNNAVLIPHRCGAASTRESHPGIEAGVIPIKQIQAFLN